MGYEPFSVLPVTKHILAVSLAAAIPSHSVGQDPPQASACLFFHVIQHKSIMLILCHLTCTVFKYISRKYVFVLNTLELISLYVGTLYYSYHMWEYDKPTSECAAKPRISPSVLTFPGTSSKQNNHNTQPY